MQFKIQAENRLNDFNYLKIINYYILILRLKQAQTPVLHNSTDILIETRGFRNLAHPLMSLTHTWHSTFPLQSLPMQWLGVPLTPVETAVPGPQGREDLPPHSHRLHAMVVVGGKRGGEGQPEH